MDTAIANHPSIQLQQLNEELAQLDYRDAQFDFTPSVNAYLSQSASFGRNLDPISNEFTQTSRQNTGVNASASLVLFNGFKRLYALKLTQLEMQNVSLNREIARRDLKLEVLTYFLEAVLTGELIQLNEWHLAYSTLMEKNMLKKIQQEIKTEHDLTEILVQKENDKLAIDNAQFQYNQACTRLRQIIGLTQGRSFKPDTSDYRILSDTTAFQGIDQLPEYQQIEIQQKLRDLQIKNARAGYFPQLAFNAGLGTGYSDRYFITDPVSGEVFVPGVSDQFNQNLYQNISFTLNIPIFNRNQTNSMVTRTEVNVERQRLEQQQFLDQLQMKLTLLQQDIQNAAETLNRAAVILDLANKDFEMAQLKYDQGVINFIELSQKKDVLYRAQNQFVQSKYNYYFKQKLLAIYYE
jgi:outer membrane protein